MGRHRRAALQLACRLCRWWGNGLVRARSTSFLRSPPPDTPLHRFALSTLLIVLALVTGACGEEGPPADLAVRPPASARRPGGIPGAFQALVWWTGQRAYPHAELPAQGYAQALEQLAVMEAAVAGEHSGAGWTPIGPHNIAGRMLAVVLNPLNPKTIYAGSASGGLWRSHTEGRGVAAWHRVPTGHGSLGVSAIAIHPTDSLTIYLGTGEVYRYQEATGGVVYRPSRGSYGVGILKSTDGGLTWVKALDWSLQQHRGVQMVRLDPTNPSRVWAATTEGVWLSTDAGATWSQSLSVVMATDLTINPSNPLEIVAACGNQNSPGRGIYRTTNGGATWTLVTAGLPPSWIGKVLFDRHPTQHSTVYASIGNGIEGSTSTTLRRSTDGGATWTVVTNTNYGSYQGWFSHYVGVNPLRPDTVFLGGVELWRSFTGGTSPEQQTSYSGLPAFPPVGGPDSPNPLYMHPDHHAMVFHPHDPDIAYFANDGGIYRTDDGASSFESVNGGLQTAQFYNGTSVAAQDSLQMMGGLQDNGTVMFSGTPRWRRPLSGDGAWTATDPRTPDRVYMSAQYMNLFRSDDGGQGSLVSISPPSNDFAFIAPYALAPTNPDRIYAAGTQVFHSSNRGDTWTVTNGGAQIDPAGNLALALTVAPSNAEVVYVTTAPNLTAAGNFPGPPNVFVTTNGGAGWTQRTAGLPDRFYTDIAVHPAHPNVAFVTASGFGSGHVFRTDDFGAGWTDISAGLPDIPVSSLVIDPLAPEHLYVGTDVGVFVTRDNGSTWEAFTQGLPEAVMVMDLVISPSDRTLRAATHGNGMYMRRLERNPVAAEPGVAGSTLLRLAGPNPFRDATAVEVSLATPAHLRLELFDAAGRRVATLANATRASGRHRFTVAGGALAPGAYVARIDADGRRAAVRLTRMR